MVILQRQFAFSHFFRCYSNALVICNHGPPTPGAGRGIAVEMSGVFTFALSPQCRGNTRNLCYIGKKGGAIKKHDRLWGKTAVVLPADCPRSVGVIAGD